MDTVANALCEGSPHANRLLAIKALGQAMCWIEVGWDDNAGGLCLRAHEDHEATDWPEYGAPS